MTHRQIQKLLKIFFNIYNEHKKTVWDLLHLLVFIILKMSMQKTNIERTPFNKCPQD